MSEQDRTEKLTRPGKRSRGVPLLFGVVSLVLVAVALTFALSSPPPSTPPLAEVAPAPQERIEVERVEQSSQFGEGAGEGECVAGDPACEGAAPAAASEAPAPPPADPAAGVDRSKGRYCYNGGLTQTSDPQSPPCKREIFAGDNGGATSVGVTRDAIRIAVPRTGGGQEDAQTILTPLVGHFNRHYEFYGRRLELVYIDGEGSYFEPEKQRAMARAVAEEQVFASLALSAPTGVFERTLADEGIVSLARGRVAARLTDDLDPYLWTIYPSVQDIHLAGAEVICSSLNGRSARHGGAEVRDRTRRFGVLEQIARSNADAGTEARRTLSSRSEACGADVAYYEYPGSGDELSNTFRRMRDDGVTTVVCSCSSFFEGIPQAAEAIDWHPEWFLPGISHQAVFLRQRAGGYAERYPYDQIAHVFGLSANLRRPRQDAATGKARFEDHYWFHAVRESDPNWEPADSGIWVDHHYDYYAQLLTLASGIQWAGPTLTPETFGDALKRLDYPNPGVGEAPWWQPAVGFGPADHGFNSDFALIWWRNPDSAGYEAGTDIGELCYVGGGTRYRTHELPANADELFFDPEAGCR